MAQHIKEGKIGEPTLMVIVTMGDEEAIDYLQFVSADFMEQG
ncbi:MAG: hypothetical protein P8Z71_07000 [Candidatus Sulfobium sp.]